MRRPRPLRDILVALCACLAMALAAPAQAAPDIDARRVILALWDKNAEDGGIRLAKIHQLAEMPLNYLGLDVRFHEIHDPLPALSEMADVRGVLTWFASNDAEDPEKFLRWSEEVVDSGRRFVIVNFVGFEEDRAGRPVGLDRLNRFTQKIGFTLKPEWTSLTYRWEEGYADPAMIGYEYPLPKVLPAFQRVVPSTADAHSYLILRQRDDPDVESHLVITTPRGGYIALDYSNYYDSRTFRRRWIVDPFKFFREAFATDELPKPDTTTLSGRRIYYSHIDGDGWRNVTTVEAYQDVGRLVLSSEVTLKELLAPYPDLPSTVGPIVGDLDPAWYGGEEEMKLAREIFELPWIEAGTHTYSHPFEWQFFDPYDPEKERPFLKEYPPRKATSKASKVLSWFGPKEEERPASDAAAGGWYRPAGQPETKQEKENDLGNYDRPRAYAIEPYDARLEIQGSLDFVNRLTPPGKRAEIILWSGNTSPYEEILRLTREAGVKNMNGGDSRFDPEFLSYAFVAPVGRQVGRQRQIYASSSNENTYTELWTDRFYGFQNLRATIDNTELPIRVKPFNVYYHIYSAEKDASLDAVIQMLDYARASEIAPVAASHYAAIAEGFYSTRFAPLGEDAWRVENRGRLQTVRFDRGVFRGVDFARSKGVVGQRRYQGSLYVALDEDHPAPVIALLETERPDVPPPAIRPYLVHGRWQVRGVRTAGPALAFRTQGFGAGEFVWRMPLSGRYRIEARRAGMLHYEADIAVGDDGLLGFTVPRGAELEELEVTVRRIGAGEG
ncbi:MAG: hypothetical protein HOH66_15235 [Rhodospirillaceae bacterium]|jgi:polysaccharide biosynthesis protein PelA|nr:hypothetical protein [Rhodospirillaceae bacterium]